MQHMQNNVGATLLIALGDNAAERVVKAQDFISQKCAETLKSIQAIGMCVKLNIEEQKQQQTVSRDVMFADFEPNPSKHPKLVEKLSQNQDLRDFLRDNFGARVVVFNNRVQYQAAAKSIEEIQPIVETFIRQIIEELTEVEVEIKDKAKVQFI